jgi:hypothetical protein
MRYRFFALLVSFFINESSLAQEKVNLSPAFGARAARELGPFFLLSAGQLEDLLKGAVVSTGKVSSPTATEQEMLLFVGGVHPRNCTRAMRKLSLYENYHNYMDFVKTSRYDEKTQRFAFVIDHTLMPFPMSVRFKIPRITGPGLYPFTFEDGFLKDLRGTVVVRDLGKYCLLALKTDWRGPKTRIPDLVFSTFVQTVGKLGLEHLIRVSLF